MPLISTLTTKVRSYTMLIVGTFVSAASVFLWFLPDSFASLCRYMAGNGFSIIGWKFLWPTRSVLDISGDFHYRLYDW